MKYFNDTTGKQWKIDVNVGSLETVAAQTGIDLTQLFSEELGLLNELYANPVILCKVLWAFNGEPESPSKPGFLAAMGGDALENAADALVSDVIDFFPNARRRELCRATLAKIKEAAEMAYNKAEKNLSELNAASLTSATS